MRFGYSFFSLSILKTNYLRNEKAKKSREHRQMGTCFVVYKEEIVQPNQLLGSSAENGVILPLVREKNN